MTRGRRSVSLLGRRRMLPGTDNHPARRDAQTTTPGARPTTPARTIAAQERGLRG